MTADNTSTPDRIESVRAALIEACAALPEADHQVLEFLSVYFVPASPPVLMQAVGKAALRTARDQDFNTNSWAALLKRLRQQSLVVDDRNGLRCNPLVAELLTRRAATEGRLKRWASVAVTGQQNVPRTYYPSNELLLRDVRLAVYGGDSKRLAMLLTSSWSPSGHGYLGRVWDLTLGNPLDVQWMRTLPYEILAAALFPLGTSAINRLAPAADLIELADEACAAAEAADVRQGADGLQSLDFLGFLRMRYRVLTGRFDEAYELSRRQDEPNHLVIRGWIHVLAGDDTAAQSCYEKALKLLRQHERRGKVYFRSEAGIYYILSLLRTDTPEARRQVATLLQVAIAQDDNPYAAVYMVLQGVLNALQGQFEIDGPWDDDRVDDDGLDDVYGSADRLGDDTDDTDGADGPWDLVVDSTDMFVVAMARYWIDPDRTRSEGWLGKLGPLCERAEAGGYRMLTAEMSDVLFRLTGAERFGAMADQTRGELGTVPLVDAVVPTEHWRRALTALTTLPQATAMGVPKPSADERLVWWLGGTDPASGGLQLEPRLQKLSKKGTWTKGREVALKRLLDDRDSLDCLTIQDIRVCECVSSYDEYSGWRRYTHKVYNFRTDRALQRLVDHPLVFMREDPAVRLELVAGEPELRVGGTSDGDQLLLQLHPSFPPTGSNVVVARESATRYRVVTLTEEHRRMAAILGPSGLRVPAASRDEVLETLRAIASLVTVQSAIGGDTGDADTVTADSRLHVLLLPQAEGLELALRVFPLGPKGPALQPGSGGATVFGRVEGRPLHTTRDLETEQATVAAIHTTCPILADVAAMEGQWTIPDPAQCLELLLQLKELGEDVVVEWPQGERFSIRRQVTLNGLSLAVHQDRDWFQLSGTLRVDDDLVLDMRRLIEMSRAAQGRFLPLGDGQFLALTEQFRRRLVEIDGLAQVHGDGARFHRLMTPLIEELAEDTDNFQADAAWQAQQQRLAQASQLEFQIPTTLQAELRDYQVEGCRWLARLAHWGVGACLADDMGLGKTLQALTIVLARAPAGPTLVVAPTSVGGNWVDEARRFAPTLRPVLLRDEDRATVLAESGPFDLVICSYALLHRERESLAAVCWQTVVLDEAQAIKNPQARRSQAAMALQSAFRLITTGTPVENHLGELWSLFRFLNPGLLGSRAQFNERYARPIERDGDGDARRRLRRLIQPFMLRRLKSEVLDELPPRTEISLTVDLSAAEKALYEALRQDAVAAAEESDAPDGQRYVQILAQIMRLRRACCHPQLALPGTDAPCAKMEVFSALLTELLAGGHKALVFSQFVDYLKIVRQLLDDRRISYQYLDGSTPAATRKKRVDAFQAGAGDIFLISLRAGGQGLNLTAADYVVHLDPWWNPAVEDQASDRAHRIGQQRPVTVYRLVTRDTIEEKIVGLHARKRELADGVLAGSGETAQLSAQELLELIRG